MSLPLQKLFFGEILKTPNLRTALIAALEAFQVQEQEKLEKKPAFRALEEFKQQLQAEGLKKNIETSALPIEVQIAIETAQAWQKDFYRSFFNLLMDRGTLFQDAVVQTLKIWRKNLHKSLKANAEETNSNKGKDQNEPKSTKADSPESRQDTRAFDLKFIEQHLRHCLSGQHVLTFRSLPQGLSTRTTDFDGYLRQVSNAKTANSFTHVHVVKGASEALSSFLNYVRFRYYPKLTGLCPLTEDAENILLANNFSYKSLVEQIHRVETCLLEGKFEKTHQVGIKIFLKEKKEKFYDALSKEVVEAQSLQDLVERLDCSLLDDFYANELQAYETLSDCLGFAEQIVRHADDGIENLKEQSDKAQLDEADLSDEEEQFAPVTLEFFYNPDNSWAVRYELINMAPDDLPRDMLECIDTAIVNKCFQRVMSAIDRAVTKKDYPNIDIMHIDGEGVRHVFEKINSFAKRDWQKYKSSDALCEALQDKLRIIASRYEDWENYCKLTRQSPDSLCENKPLYLDEVFSEPYRHPNETDPKQLIEDTMAQIQEALREQQRRKSFGEIDIYSLAQNNELGISDLFANEDLGGESLVSTARTYLPSSQQAAARVNQDFADTPRKQRKPSQQRKFDEPHVAKQSFSSSLQCDETGFELTSGPKPNQQATEEDKQKGESKISLSKKPGV